MWNRWTNNYLIQLQFRKMEQTVLKRIHKSRMKKNYKYLFLTVLMLFLLNITFAQTDGKREKIDALRTTFIAKKVNFTNAESILFWPLYNEMNDKLEAARKTFRSQYNATTDYDFKTDREAEIYL